MKQDVMYNACSTHRRAKNCIRNFSQRIWCEKITWKKG